MQKKNYKQLLCGFLLLGMVAGNLSACTTPDFSLLLKPRHSSAAQSNEEAEEAVAEPETVMQTEEASEKQPVTEAEEIVAEQVFERGEVDTDSMMPVEYSCPYGNIGLYLPEDWNYRVDKFMADQGSFSISIAPQDENDGEIILQYIDNEILEWDGAEESAVDLYGYVGYLGSYEGSQTWDYFRCNMFGGTYAIINAAGDFWWQEKENEIEQILSTVRFGEPLISESQTYLQDEEFDAAGLKVSVSLRTKESAPGEDIIEGSGALVISSENQELELIDFCYGANRVLMLPIDEKNAYILVQAIYDNDYAELFLVRADGEAGILTLCDQIEAGISTSELVTIAGMALESRINCLGTYGASKHYTIIDDHFYTNETRFHLQNESGDYMTIWEDTESLDGEALAMYATIYTEDGRRCLTLKQDLSISTSGEEDLVIPAGTQICPDEFDMDENRMYFDFMQYEEALGEFLTNYGYITFEKDESEGGYKINGINEKEVFENLPYAG